MMPRRKFRPFLVIIAFVLLLVVPALAAGEEGENVLAWTEYIFKWVNLLTVVVLAFYFGRKPLKAAFDGIRADIRKDIDEAQRQKSEAEARIAEIEHKLTRLGEETERLRTEARTEIAAQLQRIREGAQQEAERVLQMAQAEIETGRRAAGLELRAYSARLAIELAEKRLRQKLTPAIHAKLFQSFLSGIEGRS